MVPPERVQSTALAPHEQLVRDFFAGLDTLGTLDTGERKSA